MKNLLLATLVFLVGLGVAKSQTTITVTGYITTATTWTNDHIYLLNGFVYVRDGGDLTIQAGTLIKGISGTKGSLIITTSGKIHAIGTACQPIVFTSDKAPGSRTYGDWGGVILLGNAHINVPGGTAIIEGGVNDDLNSAQYGGVNDADNSGEFEYCRIEFPGIPFAPNNEINGLTFGGVGSGTTIDHVFVAYSGDDSFEWFGGDVNCKYLVAYRGQDDDWDTDQGFSGKVQFCVALRNPLWGDISGSKAFESDNDATGSANTPITKCLFSNITSMGPLANPGDTYDPNFQYGAHLRRNTECSVYNSITMGYPLAGLCIDGANTSLNALHDSLQYKDNIISGNPTDLLCISCDPSFNISTFFSSNSNNAFASNSSVGLTDPFNLSNPNFLPTGASVANFLGTYFSGRLSDPFFTSTTYRGAFNTTDDWTKGWCNWDCENTDYTNPTINYNPSLTSSITNAGCPNTGAVDLTVSAGVTPYTYSWSNGATTQDISGLAGGTYVVNVTTATGCSAMLSNSVSDVTVPKPAGLSVSALTGCSAKLSWSAVATANSYDVRYRPTGGSYSPVVNVGAATNYIFTGLSASTAYEFDVRSKCSSGEASAFAKKNASTVVCGAPTSVSVTTITATTATISWTDPCSVGKYKLQYRKTGTTAWTTVNVTGSTSKTITGLVASTSYDYRVSSNCGATKSNYTAIQTFTTHAFRMADGVIVDENALNLYPNPAQSSVTISIEAPAEVNMTIINMMGQVVYSNDHIAVNGLASVTVDVSNFDSGIYMVTIFSENIKVTKQLVVTK